MKKNSFFCYLVFLTTLIVFLSSCSKNDSLKNEKSVKIISIDSISDDLITLKIKTTSAEFKEMGVFYNNLTIVDNTLLDTIKLVSIEPNTKYFIKAFASNDIDTIFSDEISIQTSNSEIVEDIDGNKYPTVKIGNQIWMAEDLIVSAFNDNTPIQNGDHAFYAWNTVNDIRNICPQGYHLPNDQEWFELINELGGFETAGEKLKSIKLTFNKGRRFVDEYTGFSIKLNGYEYQDSIIFNKDMIAYYWSSSSFGDTISYFSIYDNLISIHNSKPVHIPDNKLKSDFKIRVRCIKD